MMKEALVFTDNLLIREFIEDQRDHALRIY